VLQPGAGAPVQPVKQRTMIGVGASQFGVNTVGAAPKQPSTLAGGTPQPGAHPNVAPPQAHTMHASRAPSATRAHRRGSTSRRGTPSSRAAQRRYVRHLGHDRCQREPARLPHPGVRINQYEMIKLIGEGGWGACSSPAISGSAAASRIKFLQSNQAELTQRFLVEARTTARCQHDNIVVIYEVRRAQRRAVHLLEFLSGKR